MARPYAGILAVLAFATVLGRSVVLGGSLEANLQVAMGCLVLFAAVGFVAGAIAEQIVRESVVRRFQNELQTEPEVLSGQKEK